MARVLLLIVVFFSTICNAQSLPPCPASGLKHNCYGGFATQQGLKYEGEWKDGKRNGQGSETLPNGGKYEGGFKDGQYDGDGVFTFPDGSKFVGEYRENRANGKGIKYDAKGSVLALGTWKNDRLISSDPVDFNRFPFKAGPGPVTKNAPPNIETAGSSSKSPSQPTNEAQLVAEAQEERKKREQLEAELAEVRKNMPRTPGTFPKQDDRNVDVTPVFAARKALIIGNDKYVGVSKLNNAIADAKAMAEALQASGYKVNLRLDLGEKQFKEELRRFRYEVKGGDEVFFFFAGHGVEIGGVNFLLPTDIKISGINEDRDRDQLSEDGIDLKRFMTELEIQKPKFTLAVIDACREDPFPKKTGTRSVSTKVGLAQTTPATGQMIIFSAGSGQKALDSLGPKDSSANGVFTRVFVEKIKEPGIPVDRILKNVRSEVSRLAKTVNHTQVPAIYDEAEGDFYFRLGKN